MKRAGFLLLMLLSACGSSAKPLGPIQSPLLPEPAARDVTHRILAYGDTRTGALIFENQDNEGEAVHDWVAQQMVARLGKEKADIVFTGDAVYSGGATFHYDNFVAAISRFKTAGLSFFPCVGNHELLAGIIGVISPWFDGKDDEGPKKFVAQAQTPEERQWGIFMVDRQSHLKRAGGKREQIHPVIVGQLDQRSKDIEDKVLPRLEDKAATKTAEERIGHAQRVMEAIYVKNAGFSYLEDFFSKKKVTYYSIEYTKAKPSILLVMLDTNSLDYPPQKAWLTETLAKSQHDLIMVFGHHPPRTIAGWDKDYLDLFKTHKKAIVWIFSHVHAFAYAFPDPKPAVLTRGLFVSGGGGAPLVDSDEKVAPIGGWEFGPANDEDGRFFHFLDIRTTKDSVFVTVLGCVKKGQPMEVKATYRIALP